MNFVYVQYNQPINGYDVSVLWTPVEGGSDILVGNAIMNFRNEEDNFNVCHSHFSLSVLFFFDSLDDYDSAYKERIKINSLVNGETISLDYVLPEISKKDSLVHLYSEVPFFFTDVNFDGEDELILTKHKQGQRRRDAFQVHSLSAWGVDDLYDIGRDKPFNNFDDGTVIDKKNKQIIIDYSGSAVDYVIEVYKLNKEGEFYLSK